MFDKTRDIWVLEGKNEELTGKLIRLEQLDGFEVSTKTEVGKEVEVGSNVFDIRVEGVVLVGEVVEVETPSSVTRHLPLL